MGGVEVNPLLLHLRASKGGSNRDEMGYVCKVKLVSWSAPF